MLPLSSQNGEATDPFFVFILMIQSKPFQVDMAIVIDHSFDTDGSTGKVVDVVHIVAPVFYYRRHNLFVNNLIGVVQWDNKFQSWSYAESDGHGIARI